MDLLTFLKQDHQAIRTQAVGLMRQANQLDQTRLSQLVTHFKTHMEMEETLLYPKIAEINELSDLSKEMVKEHQQIKTLLQKFAGKPISEIYGVENTFQELLDLLDHHVEEEENEVIPRFTEFVNQKDHETLVNTMKTFLETQVKVKR